MWKEILRYLLFRELDCKAFEQRQERIPPHKNHYDAGDPYDNSHHTEFTSRPVPTEMGEVAHDCAAHESDGKDCTVYSCFGDEKKNDGNELEDAYTDST